jgi:hypothetical protein
MKNSSSTDTKLDALISSRGSSTNLKGGRAFTLLAVPEPALPALLCTGLFGVGALRRKHFQIHRDFRPISKK